MIREAAEIVKQVLALDAPLEAGGTLREHLASAARQTKKVDPRLLRKLHLAGWSYLLDWFWDLSQSRGSTGFGPARLSFSEIEAWSRLTGNNLKPWELKAIRAMDAAYMRWAAERQKKSGG